MLSTIAVVASAASDGHGILGLLGTLLGLGAVGILVSTPPFGRLRRKTYYNVNLQTALVGSGFSALGEVPNFPPGSGVFAGILRPMRGVNGPNFAGPLPPPPPAYADGADRDMYGNLLPTNAASPSDTDRRAKDRITAGFECAEVTSNQTFAHGCIQFIAPTDEATALNTALAPDLVDPSLLPRVFIRVLFVPSDLGARLYFQKQHSMEA